MSKRLNRRRRTSFRKKTRTPPLEPTVLSPQSRPHRSRLRPTPQGVRYLLLLLVMGFAAYNTRNNLLYLMFSVSSAAGVVSLVAGWLSLKGLSLEAGRSQDVYSGVSF